MQTLRRTTRSLAILAILTLAAYGGWGVLQSGTDVAASPPRGEGHEHRSAHDRVHMMIEQMMEDCAEMMGDGMMGGGMMGDGMMGGGMMGGEPRSRERAE